MQPYVYRRPGSPKNKKPQKKFKFYLFLLLVGGGFALANFTKGALQAKKVAASSQPIKDLISQYSSATVAVSLIDLKSGQQTNFGSPEALPAASVTKLLTAAYYLRQVEAHKLSLDHMVGLFPASFQLQQMVQQSNNDAWHLLSAELNDAELTKYAIESGLASFDFDSNSVTAADQARFLQKLYGGQLLQKKHTRLLLSYMHRTNNEALIPAAVPGQTIYHKYGLLDGSLNDAAIVSSGKQAYVLVIFTRGADMTDLAARTQLIHNVTQGVQDYLR